MVCYMTHRNGGSKVAAAWALLKRFRQSPVISPDEHRLDSQRAAPTRALGDLTRREILWTRSRVVKTATWYCRCGCVRIRLSGVTRTR